MWDWSVTVAELIVAFIGGGLFTSFLAEILVLNFYKQLEGPAEELSKIARRMVNIRSDAGTPEKRRKALGAIYQDFDTQLGIILKTFRRR